MIEKYSEFLMKNFGEISKNYEKILKKFLKYFGEYFVKFFGMLLEKIR